MNSFYRPSEALRCWANDVIGGELYSLTVFDDGTVSSACGRFAHSSGTLQCSYAEFLEGKLSNVVKNTMGELVLSEALVYVSAIRV